jgi:surface protein
MKKLLLLLFLGFTLLGFSQTTLIPDPNFEQALIDLGYDTAPINGSVPTANISGVTFLDVSFNDITDLTGIEDFTALVTMDCRANELTSLDVSNNTALTFLNCQANQLTSLDVSNNTALTFLNCQANQLTSLDVSTNTALVTMDCRANELTSLDVTNNTALVTMDCRANELTSLDVTNNTALTDLSCSYNPLTSLDTQYNTVLESLQCDYNQLTSLDVSTNIALTALNSEGNSLTSLDVSNNTALIWLLLQSNQLTSLDVSNNTALTNFRCHNNQLTSLDVRNGNNTNFTYFIATNNPDLTCIFVDDASYSTTNWTNIDPNSTFVETEAECAPSCFINDSNIQAAVDLWISDPTTAEATYGNISNWDTSCVTDMSNLFDNYTTFNDDISLWDTSNVTNMSGMFRGATVFNQPIGNWNVSNVTTMFDMFDAATSFNQDIGGWDVSNVTNMIEMFRGASSFNQPIGNWDVSNVTNMNRLFEYALVFNQPIGNWDVSNVTDISLMFSKTSFNQPIENWNVSSLTGGICCVFENSPFDQDISSWDVSNVTSLSKWFKGTPFNQDISSWDVSNVEDMVWTFEGATSFNQDISSWDVSNVTSMWRTFIGATSFDQDINTWDVSNVTNMETMLSNSGISTVNYDALLQGWSAQDLQPNLNLGAHGLNYCNGEAARQSIMDNFGWTFDGDAIDPDCSPICEVEIIASATDICAGESVVLTVFGDENSSYLWSTGETGSLQETLVDEYSLVANIVSQNTFSVIPGTNYRLEITGTISLGGGAGNQRDAAYFIQTGPPDVIEGTPFESACELRIWTSLFCDDPGLRPTPDIYDPVDHTYSYPFTPTTTSIDVGFWDSPLGDNQATVVTFKLYQISSSSSITVSPSETTEYWVDVTTNGVTCRDYITINVDAEDPTWLLAPSDLTVECDGSGNTTEFNNWLNNTFSGIDNCGSVTITNSSAGLSDDCGATGTETVTFTLTDSNNNAITLDATFTIVDTTDPTIDVAASDTTVECDGSTDPGDAFQTWLDNNGGAIASDLCSSSTLPVDGLIGYWPFNGNANDESGNGNHGTVSDAILSTDRFGSNNSSYAFDGSTSKIYFSLNSIGNLIPAGSELTTSLWVKTSDLNGPLVSMRPEIPEAHLYNFMIGTLRDTEVSPGNYGIFIRDINNSEKSQFGSNVVDNNWHTLTIVSESNGNVHLYKNGNLEASVSGNNGELNFSPNFMTFGAEEYWIVGDQSGNCNSCNTVEEQYLNGQLDDIAIWNRALSAEEINNLYLGNSDTVTWTNNSTGLSDDCGATGTETVIFTATDVCGNASTTSATFTTEDTTSPFIDIEASDLIIECDGAGNTAELNAWLASIGTTGVASDLCAGITWTNDFTDLSDECGTTGSALVTFTATDACGLFSTTSATFTIKDTTAPTIDTAASDSTVECDGSGNTSELNAWLASIGTTGVASDLCAGITWTNDFTDLSYECGTTGSALVTFTATDACGLFSTTSATFTIEDTTAPVINCPSDITAFTEGGVCGAIVNFQDAIAVEQCGSVVVSQTSGLGSGSQFPVGESVIEFTAQDQCGNLSTCVFIIKVIDDDIPEAICQNLTVILDVSGVASITAAYIDNGSNDNCGVDTLEINIDTFDCSHVGDNTVILTVTDFSGNESSCSATVTVYDLLAPQIECPANEIVNLDPDGTYTLGDYIGDGIATVTDNCSDPVTIFTQDPAPGTLLGLGIHVITFTAEDEYGNGSTCSFELDVEEILGTNDTQDFASLVLYPNPADRSVYVSNPRQMDLIDVTLYDLTGRILTKINLSNMGSEISIDVSTLANAPYLLVIRGSQGTSTKTLIVNN